MCRYRYCYFLGCRHSKTILIEFCENAQLLSGGEQPERTSDASAPAQQHEGGEESTAAGESVGKEESDTITENSDLLSICSTTLVGSSHTPDSPFDNGFSAEPGIDYTVTSLPAVEKFRPSSSSTEVPSHDMAGIPFFDFRQWMSGTANSTVVNASNPDEEKATSKDSSGHAICELENNSALQSRRKQPGIREDSDESWDLPKWYRPLSTLRVQDITDISCSSDIMQHIAESYRYRKSMDTRVSGHHLPSYSSVTAGRTSHEDLTVARQAYDDIEAEIDMLKEDVMKLRQGADKGRTTPKTEQELDLDKYLSTRSKGGSAAARLQKLHEATEQSRPSTEESRTPTPLDFPALSEFGAMAARATQLRKSSYAQALAASTEPTQESPGVEGDERSVIVRSHAFKLENKQSSPKRSKDIPHFAQPTKSFARRADETRKDPTLTSPRSQADVRKEPKLSTARRAAEHQQKRKSLPGEWTSEVGQKHRFTPGTPTKGEKFNGAVSDGASPKSRSGLKGTDDSKAVVGVKEKATKLKVKAKKTHPSSPDTPKSSYMAPTAAAARRSNATTDTSKKQIECTQDPIQTPIDSGRDAERVSECPSSSTAVCESSSVHFILDRTILKPEKNANAAHKPSVPSSEIVSQRDATSKSTMVRPMDLCKTAGPETSLSEIMTLLPNVANTTTKRRTSHGHLLKPIVACLDSKGLLNKNVANNAVIEAYLQRTAQDDKCISLGDTRETEPETPCRRSEMRSGSSLVQPDAPPRRVLPPHLRKSRISSNTSSSTEATLCQQMQAPASAVQQQVHIRQSAEPVRRDSVMSALEPASEASSNHADMESLRKTSLRATAKVFEPKPLRIANETLHTGNTNGFIPEPTWHQMSPEERADVFKLREATKSRGWYTFGVLPAQQNWNGFLPGHIGLQPFGGQIRPQHPQGVILPASVPTVHNVQAGRVLTPSLSPGRNNMHWMMRDLDGKETPVKFGRAPPPTATPDFGSGTPGPFSTPDSAPVKTPHTLSGWRIGSAFASTPYGWKGGDGKEISFSGYGPHAERDPNKTINFNFQGASTKFTAAVSNGFDEDKENSSPSEIVAPRSQRQWAEKLGYQRIPCGNVEITHAVEQMPFGSEQLAGYCYDCAAR